MYPAPGGVVSQEFLFLKDEKSNLQHFILRLS